MTSKVSLCAIFRELLDDPNFLNIEYNVKPKKNQKTVLNFVNETIRLIEHGDSKEFQDFSNLEKMFLNPKYRKHGIIGKIETDIKDINCSFLQSVNIAYLGKQILDTYPKYLESFEKYMRERIRYNYQIDKGRKNNKKNKELNEKLADELSFNEVKSDLLLKRVACVLESNILIFDKDDDEKVYLFASTGNKYTHLNLFNKLLVLSRTNNMYEPFLIDTDDTTEIEKITRIVYINIINNLELIENNKEINIDYLTLCKLFEPDINLTYLMPLIEKMKVPQI